MPKLLIALALLLFGCSREADTQIPSNIEVAPNPTISETLGYIYDQTAELDIDDIFEPAKVVLLSELKFQTNSAWLLLYKNTSDCTTKETSIGKWLISSGLVPLRLETPEDLTAGTYLMCLRADDGDKIYQPASDLLISEDGKEPENDDFEVLSR
jgi:hypothetical protein